MTDILAWLRRRWVVVLVASFGGICILGLLAAKSASTAASGAVDGSIPPDARANALAYLAQYDPNARIIASGQTTLGAWDGIEPANVSGAGIEVTPANATDVVYGFIVVGTFVVTGPPPPPGGIPPDASVYHQGRIVVDARGDVLSAWEWPDGLLDAHKLTTVFGPQFVTNG